jgi:hypothetical protein
MIEGHVALAISNAAELTMLAEMRRGAMIRNEPVDLDGLIRLEGVARRAVADMRQLAREVRGEVQPSMTIEKHIRATYGQRRSVGLPETPEARPGPTPPPPHETRRTANSPGGARHPTRRPTTGGRADDQG